MFSFTINILWYIIQFWLALYMLIPSILLLIYLIKNITKSNFNIRRKKIQVSKDFTFAAIITAHEDTTLVLPLVDSLLKQTYENVYIYVVADACNNVSNLPIEHPRLKVLLPSKALNSKIKSIDFALENFSNHHDVLVIFDSDNLVHPKFMEVLNGFFQRGYRAVQTNLQPKNKDSLYARLDSIGDTFHSFNEREMRMELGLSSAIWGLGIAVETDLYREIVYENFLGGFDKRIQADLVRTIPQIAYAKEAMVYDEKISDGKALEKQRTRWINAYFKYLRLSIAVVLHGIRHLNFNIFYFGFINLRPPLFIMIGISLVFAIINFFISPVVTFIWISLIFLYGVSFIMIVWIKTDDKKTTSKLLYVPLVMLRQVAALFSIKKANKSFLKTDHSKVIYIDDILKNESN